MFDPVMPSTPSNAVAPTDTFDLAAAMDLDSDIGVFVDPDDGSLVVHVPSDPDGAFKPLTRLEISARSDVFLPRNKLAGTLEVASDLLTGSQLLKIDDNGFGTVNFGPILRHDVSASDLASVFSVSAMFDGGEVAGAVQFVSLATVPEPSTGLICLFSAFLILSHRRLVVAAGSSKSNVDTD